MALIKIPWGGGGKPGKNPLVSTFQSTEQKSAAELSYLTQSMSVYKCPTLNKIIYPTQEHVITEGSRANMRHHSTSPPAANHTYTREAASKKTGAMHHRCTSHTGTRNQNMCACTHPDTCTITSCLENFLANMTYTVPSIKC